jgi:nucleotide-binding universal stress UspA family protein
LVAIRHGNRRSVAGVLWGKEALMTEERFAEIQQELEALEASLAPEEIAVGDPHPFILILLMLERQGASIQEMSTRLSNLEREVHALTRGVEGSSPPP